MLEQNLTVGGMLSDMGLSGQGGIACTRDPDDSTGTSLLITVTPPAWAVLPCGCMFGPQNLHSARVSGLDGDGVLTLWLDHAAHGNMFVPIWSMSVHPPGVDALAVATVTVTDGRIGAVVTHAPGLRGMFTPQGTGAQAADVTGAGVSVPTASGPTVRVGEGPPSDEGNPADRYIDIMTGDVFLYAAPQAQETG